MLRDGALSEQVAAEVTVGLNAFMSRDDEHPDLCVSIGGDGTMLASVNKYTDQLDRVVFVGLHTGTLGFFTDYQMQEVDTMIEDIRNNPEPPVEEREMLKIEYKHQTWYALNEVRVENNRHSQVIDVEIDGEYFEAFHGNGLCISTSSGSTGYNKSVGGAVMAPGAKLMQIAEITPINHNAFRSLASPLVVKDKSVITLKTNNFEHTVMCMDSRSFEMRDSEKITVQIAQDRTARFASYRHVSFLERLQRAFL